MRNGEVHRLSVLLFTDIVGSVQLQESLGTRAYADLLNRHDALFREAIGSTSGKILKHTGDGFLAEFAMSSEAVAAALRFQCLMHAESWIPEPLRARVGLHQGEVMVMDPGESGDASPLAVGMAVNLAARVMDLAQGNQILITRPVYENARYYLKDRWDIDGEARDLRWVAHGNYEIKGSEGSLEMFEVGVDGVAPCIAPEGGVKSSRVRKTPMVAELDLAEVSKSDVYMSYARLDDEPLAEGESGWVTRLQQALTVRLGQLLGRQAIVCRDPKPSGTDIWHDGLTGSLAAIPALVPVISPPFLQAQGCHREINAFLDRQVETAHRLVQVMKTPVLPEEIPSDLQQSLRESSRVDFFAHNSSGNVEPFDDSLGEDSRRRFLHGVYDLAYEISKTVKRASSGMVATVDLPEKTVYLAETTQDLRAARDQIRRELLERGYRVLPDRPLPLVASELEQRVSREMDTADVIIHMIGHHYGVIPEQSDRSIAELQCQWSAKLSEDGSMPRFFWAPSNLEFEDRRQESFFHALEQGDYGMQGTELVRGSLEELKRLAIGRLTAEPELAANALIESNSNHKMVYLVCDPNDESSVEPIEDHLYELGYDVKLPPHDGDVGKVAEVHRQILTVCDGVLIYFGKGSNQWVEMNLMDLMKAPAYGRKKPLIAQAVYVAPPFNRRKERFRTRSAMVMRNDDASFEPHALKPFLEKLGPPSL